MNNMVDFELNSRYWQMFVSALLSLLLVYSNESINQTIIQHEGFQSPAAALIQSLACKPGDYITCLCSG